MAIVGPNRRAELEDDCRNLLILGIGTLKASAQNGIDQQTGSRPMHEMRGIHLSVDAIELVAPLLTSQAHKEFAATR